MKRNRKMEKWIELHGSRPVTNDDWRQYRRFLRARPWSLPTGWMDDAETALAELKDATDYEATDEARAFIHDFVV